jgi:hypothetical protein
LFICFLFSIFTNIRRAEIFFRYRVFSFLLQGFSFLAGGATKKTLAGNTRLCVSGADGVEPSALVTTLSFGSGSTQGISALIYVLNFCNLYRLLFRARHFSNAPPNAKPLTLVASLWVTVLYLSDTQKLDPSATF